MTINTFFLWCSSFTYLVSIAILLSSTQIFKNGKVQPSAENLVTVRLHIYKIVTKQQSKRDECQHTQFLFSTTNAFWRKRETFGEHASALVEHAHNILSRLENSQKSVPPRYFLIFLALLPVSFHRAMHEHNIPLIVPCITLHYNAENLST